MHAYINTVRYRYSAYIYVYIYSVVLQISYSTGLDRSSIDIRSRSSSMHEPKLINKGMKYVRINVAVTIVDLVGVEEGWHDRLCLLEMEPTVCAVWVNTRSKRSEGHEIQICLAEEELHVHTSRILWMWKVCLSSGRPNSPAGIASLRSGGVTSMPSTVVEQMRPCLFFINPRNSSPLINNSELIAF